MRTIEDGMDLLRQFLMLGAQFFISSHCGHQVIRQSGNGRGRRFRARGRTAVRLLINDGFCAAAELVSARSPKASKSTRRPAMFCRVASSTGSGVGLVCASGAGVGWAGGGSCPAVCCWHWRRRFWPAGSLPSKHQPDTIGHEQQTKKRSKGCHGFSLIGNQHLIRRQKRNVIFKNPFRFIQRGVNGRRLRRVSHA